MLHVQSTELYTEMTCPGRGRDLGYYNRIGGGLEARNCDSDADFGNFSLGRTSAVSGVLHVGRHHKKWCVNRLNEQLRAMSTETKGSA